jgi:hypothetical protein
MVPFTKDEVASFDVMRCEDGTAVAVNVRLKDGTFRTVTVDMLDEEGIEFFGITGGRT